MNKKEEIKILSEEVVNPFDKAEQDKQDKLLADDIMKSGLLFTKKGRESLGIKLTPYKREYPKIGRNELCPCGSNKKYKKCCG